MIIRVAGLVNANIAEPIRRRKLIISGGICVAPTISSSQLHYPMIEKMKGLSAASVIAVVIACTSADLKCGHLELRKNKTEYLIFNFYMTRSTTNLCIKAT